MSSKPMAKPTDSKLQRALWASPLLVTAFIARQHLQLDKVMPKILDMAERGLFETEAGDVVRITTNLSGIHPVDEAFNALTIVFSNMIMGFDQLMYWQTFNFITGFFGLYSILLFESGRIANQNTIMRFPVIPAFLAQALGIGFIGPLYFFCYHVSTPLKKLQTGSGYRIDRAYAAAVPLAIICGSLVFHFLSYLHPSLEARSFWTWIWQPSPIWVSLLTYVFRTIQSDRGSALPIVNRTVGSFMVLSTGMYWTTLYFSGFSPAELFIPDATLSASVMHQVRTMMQWEDLTCYTSCFTWLALQFSDMYRHNMLSWGLLPMLLVVSIACIIFGPAATFAGIWLVRENLLASKKLSPTVAAKAK